MSYIGQQPVVGRYIKIDQISGGFNGTASGFTLAAGGQGVLPGTARNLMLSLGGVIQEPEVDFIISGSGLTFTTPPLAGTTFFCVVFGDMQAIGQPSDGTVAPASISTSGTFVFPSATITGNTLIASGSAASPSLSIIGDSDTGLYSPGANQVGIATNGSQKILVNSAGLVTISGSLDNPPITGTIIEDVYTIVDGAAFEIDPGNGSVQLITLGASRTPKATNFVAGESITLMVNDGTGFTLTWTDATWGGSGVIWTGGSAPTLALTGYTVIQFWKVGTQVYGALVGEVA